MRRYDPWILSLAACCMAAAVWAGFAPLADPDFPMHLSIGEWISTQHRVPFKEPFAWTRAGEPYYAYSWIAQLAFFATMRAFGPIGLHVLAGVTAMTIVLAGAAAGRSMGLDVSRSTILGVLSIVTAMESTPFLRPQLFMFALLPLAWASAFWLVRPRSASPVYPALALWMITALAAGIHITFPVVAAPLVLLWARVRADEIPRLILATVVVMTGWFTSPYALHWPDVFALNFGYDAILSGPSPPGELTPGFKVSPLVGVGLALLPFLADVRATRLAERLALALLWLAGLMLFSQYFKGLGPWWWCALPLVVMALRRLPEPSDRRIDLSWAVLTPLALLAFAPTNIRLWKVTHVYEGGMESRSLPSLKAFATEPAAGWLESHTEIPRGTRLLTTTNYGSYLKWRLPAVSESVDSRSVFPDSVELPDVPSLSGDRAMGPWASSDIAIVPETYPVAAVLDRHPEWRRIGTAVRAPWAPTAPRAGLWAKRAWLASHARTSLPVSSMILKFPESPRTR
ncbi:MAG: hypothetical protein DMD35_15695 [Gemmatimonadetes bacterium]|nr:MAG: hypothetical protein DMD35_15695 [Gemmatimonadota bacterium]